MAEGSETKQRKTRKKNQTDPQTVSNVSIEVPQPQLQRPSVPQAPAIGLPEEVRDELTTLMQELLLKTHELSFEYSTLDCEEIQTCPLARKSKELFKVVKKLNNLMKKVAPPSRTPYTA